MAMQNEIQGGRHGQLFTRVFGLRGPNPVPQLAPEISPVLNIGQLPPEHLLYQDERLAMGCSSSNQAGKYNASAFAPTGTGLVFILERVLIGNSSATPYSFSLGFTFGTTPVVTAPGLWAFRDARTAGFPAGLVQGVYFDAAPTGYCGLVHVGPNSTLTIALDVVLVSTTPYFVVSCRTVTGTAMVTFFWRERALHQSEQI